MKSCASLVVLVAASLVTFGSCNETGLPPLPVPDTTSHQIAWEVTTIGDGRSSVFNDVAIINDTLALAVGEIHVLDSTGQWTSPPYNFARWNGQIWKLSTTTATGYGYGPLYSILAFGPNDVWVGSSIPEHWDGQQWTFHGSTQGYQGGFWIRRIWGTSSRDLLVVGDGGNLRRFDGTTWQNVLSGTTLDITDIFGARHGSSGNLEIIAVASEYLVSSDRRLLGISGATVTILSDNGIDYSLRGIWFVPGEHYYAVGSGIYEKRSLQESVWLNGPLDITSYHTYAVRGTAANDVFVCGDFGEILHFNGSTWHSYRSETALSSGAYFSLAVQGDEIIAVGENLGQAVVARGRRLR